MSNLTHFVNGKTDPWFLTRKTKSKTLDRYNNSAKRKKINSFHNSFSWGPCHHSKNSPKKYSKICLWAFKILNQPEKPGKKIHVITNRYIILWSQFFLHITDNRLH